MFESDAICLCIGFMLDFFWLVPSCSNFEVRLDIENNESSQVPVINHQPSELTSNSDLPQYHETVVNKLPSYDEAIINIDNK